MQPINIKQYTFKKTTRRWVSLLLSFSVLPILLMGQNCTCISTSKNKVTGIVSFTGVTSSKENYSLMINKQVNYLDTTIAAKYMIYFTASSNISFTDSIQNVLMTIELQFTNHTSLVLDSVKCLTNPSDFVPSLEFQISLTESQIRNLSINPIESINAKSLFTAKFTGKKIKQQKRIFTCLLN